MTKQAAVCLTGVLVALALCEVCDASLGLRLLPRGRPFRLTFADPRELKMALSFEGDSKIHAGIGNYFSLMAVQPADSSDWQVHFGLEGAGYFTMRQEGNRFPLETTDGLLGLYLEGNEGPWQLQFRYTHISAHLADGSSSSAPISYSREKLTLRAGYGPSDTVQIYFGPTYLVHTIPLLPRWGIQTGGSVFLPWQLDKVVPFVGLDLKWQEESPVNPSAAVELGFALNNPPEAYRSLRFFYTYLTGADPRGQYFNQPYTAHSVGVEMQI